VRCGRRGLRAAARKCGLKVVKVMVLVDRQEGGPGGGVYPLRVETVVISAILMDPVITARFGKLFLTPGIRRAVWRRLQVVVRFIEQYNKISNILAKGIYHYSHQGP